MADPVHVHINRPASFPVRHESHCPTCESTQRFAGYAAIWYGATMTCLGCGDSWQDGGMLPRPFKPRWRSESRDGAERIREEASKYTETDFHEWLKDQIGATHDGE